MTATNLKLPIITDPADTFQRDTRNALRDLARVGVGEDGEDGATGATGATGPAGPAPAGTGFVKVTAGVLDVPSASIAQAVVTDLVADLADKVETASSVGAGSSVWKDKVTTDLRFRSIIGTGAAAVTQNANDITIEVDVSDVAIGFFGTGEAGNLTFDGVTTVNVPDASGVTTALAASVGIQSAIAGGAAYNQHIMSFDIFANDVTISPGVWLYTGGYRLFVAGTLNIGAGGGIGHWGADGANGPAGSALGGAGGAGRANGLIGGSTAGGLGGGGGGGPNPGGFGAANTEGAKGMTAGAASATGGTCQGGRGGAADNGVGADGGAITILGNNTGQNLSSVWSAIHGRTVTGTIIKGGSGGGGGRGGTVGGNGSGAGGGGGGGGVSIIAARETTGTGIINCGGGYGGDAGPLATGISGAGGGGGGGVILYFLGTGSFPTCSAAAGLHGSTAHNANTTANEEGFDGGPGLIYKYRLGA